LRHSGETAVDWQVINKVEKNQVKWQKSSDFEEKQELFTG